MYLKYTHTQTGYTNNNTGPNKMQNMQYKPQTTTNNGEQKG